MNIAFFDFDGTMAKGDSLLGFVAFVRGKKRLYWGLFSRCFILIGYALGLISNTKAKQAVMRYFFANMDYKEFLQECERFCPDLESRLKPAALARLQWHKDRGDVVVMVSASFEEYLAPLCAKLGMECIGTRLATQTQNKDSRGGDSVLGSHSDDFADFKATADLKSCSALKSTQTLESTFLSGEFATPNCYGEQKAVRIKARYDLSRYEEIYAYGDSKGDTAMLALATHAFYKPF
ncbi:haloacid dehalogenase-like hydrolase [Helicobacter canis]|uniref:HAD-IB family hydrolase n=1 Tax=Helicobacter canis TaxID=29419 RepID=A0A5M9QS37_9HELI|nr:haloacid dehalogenase-like hydrolase [Helicobacter canis]KAA8711021.1 HAD-IB family hydrolase [Helicobacter canis]